jgi:hypothetical protein
MSMAAAAGGVEDRPQNGMHDPGLLMLLQRPEKRA